MKGNVVPKGAAVFVDRDGTLNEDMGYVTTPEQFILIEGVPEAIARLNQLGIYVFIVTNQSAIGRGLMTPRELDLIHAKFLDHLQPFGGYVDGLFYCPHHPEEGCMCRKPQIGMIQQAVERFSPDLSHSFLIGDKKSDLQAAQNASIPGVLVRTSPYSEDAIHARDEGLYAITYVADTFKQAVWWIEDELKKKYSDSLSSG